MAALGRRGCRATQHWRPAPSSTGCRHNWADTAEISSTQLQHVGPPNTTKDQAQGAYMCHCGQIRCRLCNDQATVSVVHARLTHTEPCGTRTMWIQQQQQPTVITSMSLQQRRGCRRRTPVWTKIWPPAIKCVVTLFERSTITRQVQRARWLRCAPRWPGSHGCSNASMKRRATRFTSCVS